MIFLFLSLVLMGACTPELTFYVTRPARLPVEDVTHIVIGSFDDRTGEVVAQPDGSQISSGGDLTPAADRFAANSEAALFIRSMVLAGISASGQYQLVDSEIITPDSGGAAPDPTRTAVISAAVRYYEFTREDAETVFYLLLATRGGLNLRDQALLLASKQAIIAAAERDRKGFKVETPYIEKVAAMEVAFDLTRQSSGEKIVDTQRYRAYFAQKWGGNPETSHLSRSLKKIIIAKYQKDESLSRLVRESAGDLELALLDPDEYLARGGKLQINRRVVKNSLQIQADLARYVVDEYLRQISRYTEETRLEIASGDPIAVNYLKGNAYELAINRLENLQRKEADSYNLALAYESIAENRQAARYYQEALSKSPNNEAYNRALQRVQGSR